jgi:hypothetical protein
LIEITRCQDSIEHSAVVPCLRALFLDPQLRSFYNDWETSPGVRSRAYAR